MPKILTLRLKRKWWEQIRDGVKSTEFRIASEYWRRRLFDADGVAIEFDEVHLWHAYPPAEQTEFRLIRAHGGTERIELTHDEFGPNPVDVFEIDISREVVMKTKSALPWFGTDASVGKRLGAMFDGCDHVTITHVGGASIIQHLTAKGIVANDLHRRAIDFYLVASGQMGSRAQIELVDQCRRTLSHPAEMERAARLHASGDMVARAWSFWAACWIGRKGKGGTKSQGGKPSVRRRANGGNNATRITSAANDLEAWAAEFKRCEWTCEDFRECLSKVADDSSCGIYLDPPWVTAGAGYLHSYTEQVHRDQALCLKRFELSPIVVRYGDEPLVHEHYPTSDGWRWDHVETRTQANTKIPEVWISKRVEVV